MQAKAAAAMGTPLALSVAKPLTPGLTFVLGSGCVHKGLLGIICTGSVLNPETLILVLTSIHQLTPFLELP